MFNSVNNPFNKRINTTFSAGQDKKQREQEQEQDKERNYLEDDNKDEVSIGGLPILTEEQIEYMVQNYIANLKSQHEDNPKVIEKLDKYLSKFDIKKFMKQNPNMTSADFHMVMYNETAKLVG